VILDEIGRGTATFDGLSIAWAVVEYISRQIGARTLFATHYHELTVLAESLPGVRNFHVTVRKSGDGILFLRKIAPGPAAGSYGIEVARLAGIPASVVGRAREILEKHEASGRNLSDDLSPRASRDNVRRDQLALFSPAEEELRRDLARIDIDRTSPLEALRILADLKKKSGRS
jgi:DNA mismatch repair protein MutS